MDIRVNKSSDVPVHEQIAAQIVFAIGTGRLEPDAELPSVRALAMRLQVHRNTVVRAYQDLTLNLLVEKTAGRRLVVRGRGVDQIGDVRDLDDLLTVTIMQAQRRGYSLAQLQERLIERLRRTPPNRVLVVSDDAGMRLLLPREVTERLGCGADGCCVEDLSTTPERSLGCLVLAPQGQIRASRNALPPNHPIVTLTYSPAHDHVVAIERLQSPSLILLVSVSASFLEMARSLLAPTLGRRHELRTQLMTGRAQDSLGAADLVFCDELTHAMVRTRYKNVMVYRAIADTCLRKLKSELTP